MIFKVKTENTAYWFMSAELANDFIMKVHKLNIECLHSYIINNNLYLEDLYGYIENHIAILNRPPTKYENKMIFGD